MPHASAAGAAEASGVIGPNAITRMAQALDRHDGATVCRQIFAAAGLERHLDHPPAGMVNEMDVAWLHHIVVEKCGAREAEAISRDAGYLTADYLLAHRIPRAAQCILRRLPRAWSARVLTGAIARHAWTFAGSGRFTCEFGKGLQMKIEGSPVCRLLRTASPACAYYSATFEHVFAAILGPLVRVTETACEARGDALCTFRVVW